jgi:hypothetical protein
MLVNSPALVLPDERDWSLNLLYLLALMGIK